MFQKSPVDRRKMANSEEEDLPNSNQNVLNSKMDTPIIDQIIPSSNKTDNPNSDQSITNINLSIPNINQSIASSNSDKVTNNHQNKSNNKNPNVSNSIPNTPVGKKSSSCGNHATTNGKQARTGLAAASGKVRKGNTGKNVSIFQILHSALQENAAHSMLRFEIISSRKIPLTKILW
jgi:hypothetical protein